jgi:hypothetical protein
MRGHAQWHPALLCQQPFLSEAKSPRSRSMSATSDGPSRGADALPDQSGFTTHVAPNSLVESPQVRPGKLRGSLGSSFTAGMPVIFIPLLSPRRLSGVGLGKRESKTCAAARPCPMQPMRPAEAVLMKARRYIGSRPAEFGHDIWRMEWISVPEPPKKPT